MNTGDTPVRIAYCQGISNFMNWYDLEYPVIFIVAAFALACTYAKDSLSGINELTLSAAKGRKKDFRARWIAGNLFTASVYIIFIGVLLIEHGAVATFGGFGASAQTYWFHCILNINIGTGMLFKIVGGLSGTLVFANFTMLLSCLSGNLKIASAASVLAVAALTRLSGTYSQMISIIIMPLFADDAQTKMKELCQSAKNGKKRFDLARITTAFGVGSILYFAAVIFYFLVKMIPFEFSGGGEYIQSNEETFYSVFHITYAEQFVWNCSRGYIVLIFVISMTILLAVLMEKIMAGIAAVSFYWILLLIMEKMISFEVNHVFANFMPLRLSGSRDFYTNNEIYRFAGKTFQAIINKSAGGILIESLWLQLRQRRKHQVFQIYAVND